MRALALAAVAVVSLGASAAPASVCDAAPSRCSCREIPAEFMARDFTDPRGPNMASRYTFFMLATAVDRAWGDSLYYGGVWQPLGETRVRFTVQRTWDRPGSPAVPRTEVMLVDHEVNCPIPRFTLGRQYLVGVLLERGTFAAGACSGLYPAESLDTRHAVAVLDSLIRRRR